MYFDKLQSTIFLVFDRKITQMNIPTQLESLQVELLQGNKTTQLVVTNETLEETMKRKVLKIKIDQDQLTNVSLKITSKIKKDKRLLQQNRSLYQELTKPFSKVITNVSYYKSEDLQDYKRAGSVLSITMKVLTVLCLFTSLPSALSLMMITQTINMQRMSSRVYPANLLTFTRAFSSNIFTLIPNVVPTPSILRCNMPETLFREEISCIGLDTTGGEFILVLVYMIIFLVYKIYDWLQRVEDKKRNRLSKRQRVWVNKIFSVRVLIFVLMMVERDLLTVAALSLSSRPFKEALIDTIIQSVIIVGFVCFSVLLTTFHFVKTSLIHDESLQKIAQTFPALEFENQKLTDHLENKTKSGELRKEYYMIVMCFFNLFASLATGFGPKFSFNSLGPCGVMSLMVSLYILWRIPNKSARLNVFEFLIYLLSAFTYGIAAYMDSVAGNPSGRRSLSEKELYLSFGWSFVAITTLNCCLVILNALATVCQSCYYLLKVVPEKKIKKAKERQIIEDMNEDVQINFHHLKSKNRNRESELQNLSTSKSRVPYKPKNRFIISNKDEDIFKSSQK